MRALAIVSIFLGLTASLGFAGGKKQDAATVSFHMEVDRAEGAKFVFPQVIAGEERFFSTSADIAAADVAAIQPFAAEDGITHGVVLQLDQRGANRLAAATGANIGRMMLAFVNGRLVDALLVDQMIQDGKLVIWSGLSAQDLALLDELAPRIGEDQKAWKKRLKSR